MRALLYSAVLAFAIAVTAGCSRQTRAGSSPGPSSQPELQMPKEDDIFAITVWNQTRLPAEDLTALVAAAPRTANEDRSPGYPSPGPFAPRPNALIQSASSPVQEKPWRPIPPQTAYWEGKFKVTEKDVREMLKTWHQVTQEQWKHYSHVEGGDLGGWVILQDGGCIQWMMKPGGLGWVRFADTRMIYLSKTAPP